MTEGWRAPKVKRGWVGLVTGERQALEDWLEFHRATLLDKCAGLDAEQLCARSVAPADLSLIGLVRHMTEVERGWFRRQVEGEDIAPIYYSEDEPDGDFEGVDPARVEADLAAYQAELEACRAAASRHDDLDEEFPTRGRDSDKVRNLRWIYLHMVEEYARHNGHADLIRQAIDGTTGI